MLAVKHPESLNPHPPRLERAKQNAANLQITAGNFGKRAHRGQRIWFITAPAYSIKKGHCGAAGNRDRNPTTGTICRKKFAVGNSPRRFIIGQVPKVKEIESRLERTEQQLRLFQKISRLMVREMSLQE